ncbi:MAG TPA: hypothetical protein G4O03_05665 [Dehalococcoidia bacterium]|nr:hypothetical protein [Dehalococcoidia bacterium]
MEETRISQEDRELVGRRLGQILKQRGWSKEYYADKCDLPFDYVMDFINGQPPFIRQHILWKMLIGLEYVDARANNDLQQGITWEDFKSYLLPKNRQLVLEFPG